MVSAYVILKKIGPTANRASWTLSRPAPDVFVKRRRQPAALAGKYPSFGATHPSSEVAARARAKRRRQGTGDTTTSAGHLGNARRDVCREHDQREIRWVRGIFCVAVAEIRIRERKSKIAWWIKIAPVKDTKLIIHKFLIKLTQTPSNKQQSHSFQVLKGPVYVW